MIQINSLYSKLMLHFLSCCFQSNILRLIVLSEAIMSVITPPHTHPPRNYNETPCNTKHNEYIMESFYFTEDFKFPIALQHIFFNRSRRSGITSDIEDRFSKQSAAKVHSVYQILVRIRLLSASEILSYKIQ